MITLSFFHYNFTICWAFILALLFTLLSVALLEHYKNIPLHQCIDPYGHDSAESLSHALLFIPLLWGMSDDIYAILKNILEESIKHICHFFCVVRSLIYTAKLFVFLLWFVLFLLVELKNCINICDCYYYLSYFAIMTLQLEGAVYSSTYQYFKYIQTHKVAFFHFRFISPKL